MAAPIAKVTHLLGNILNQHFLKPTLTKTLTQQVLPGQPYLQVLPGQQYLQVRTCVDTPKKVNQQKRLLKWVVNRDWNNRKLVKQYGPQRQRLNAIRKNKILPQEVRDLASAEIHALPRRSSITHTFPRCVLTGKARGRVKRWRLSRIQWRLFADYNNLSGVTRAIW